jgi:hypothetical protein
LRKRAANEFEKDFFKLMSNATFGKTMENKRNRVNMEFITSNSEFKIHHFKKDRTIERKLASPLYTGHQSSKCLWEHLSSKNISIQKECI